MKYATFWQRLGAAVIDLACVMPIVLFCIRLRAQSKGAAFIVLFPLASVSVAYNIYAHGRFGKTIGKLCTGIRLVSLSGAPVTWRQAWLRSSVDTCLAALWAAGLVVALTHISDSQYSGAGSIKQTHNILHSHEPPWLALVDAVSYAWMASELVVMLLNRQRRALHDFIAGTIVVQDGRQAPPPVQA